MRSIATAAFLSALLSPVLLTAQPASAQKVVTPSASDLPTNSSQAPEQASFEDVRPSGAPVSLSINMGTLIHLPGAAKTVFVANPDIADVNKNDATPDLIYLFAKKGGSTVLYAVDASGHLLLNKVIHVEPGPVAIIRRGTIETGEPAPVQNNLVLSLQPAVAPQPAAPASP